MAQQDSINPGPAGAYNPPAGAYNAGPGPYQPSPAGAYQPSYQQPQQTTVYVYKDDQAERDREMAEDCCLLACCWATICCCLAANT